MKKVIRTGVIAAATACVSVGVVVAQAPQASESTTAAKSITITGCVQAAEKAPTGTSGTTGAPAAAADTKFVLKNAMASASAAGAAGTAGTSGTASEASPVASEYRLDADDAKLSPHVGHKVEITGTAPKPSSAAPSSAASATPKLKVDSVKMISATCP
jgi:hypothetical protein